MDSYPPAPTPLVSVIIVTWNCADYLPRCLDCLKAQSVQDFEVVIVDNASSDDGISDLEAKHPELTFTIEKLAENTGFAVANNVGAQLARGSWLVLLNSDAFPEPDWLAQLLRAAQEHPEYTFFASRQIQAGQTDLLDGEGDAYHVSGLAWRRQYGMPVYPAGLPEEVFSPCGAAAMYARADFLAVNGFDEDFYAYHEDVDLGFRLRLLGKRCLYVPEAVVYHIGSASSGKMSDFSVYHGHRNLVWSFFKNMPGWLFWAYLPLHLAVNVYLLVTYSLRGRSKVFWRAKRDALLGLPKNLRKRKEIQSQRVASPAAIHAAMSRNWLEPHRVSHQHPGSKVK
jgi:GT2 family glycosyltransferase